ncbi:hypothetical protein C455_06856 [Haloferax larsenii JCM 13917]|nr:DUF6544 family protein [Haloferax larsenii]ELZ80571.1 hypothetical protein C455_06856 [Haloferax larsenii JCM 13917]
MNVSRRAILLGVLGVGSIASLVASRVWKDDTKANLFAEFEAAQTPVTRPQFSPDDVADLPDPIQRYLKHVLDDGQPYVQSARLHQTGEFRLGDADSPWKPLEATQHYSVEPPGFVWDARIELFPFVPVHVVDAFVRGRGTLRAKLFSVVTVADAKPSPKLDEGELHRYLAEMVWFPTAFLPGQHVEWDPVGESAARATIEFEGTSVSAVFHVDENDEITRVTADRWYETDDGGYEKHPWTGYFEEYHDVDGLLVPQSGVVEWNLPDETVPYWRATIDELSYEFAELD